MKCAQRERAQLRGGQNSPGSKSVSLPAEVAAHLTLSAACYRGRDRRLCALRPWSTHICFRHLALGSPPARSDRGKSIRYRKGEPVSRAVVTPHWGPQSEIIQRRGAQQSACPAVCSTASIQSHLVSPALLPLSLINPLSSVRENGERGGSTTVRGGRPHSLRSASALVLLVESRVADSMIHTQLGAVDGDIPPVSPSAWRRGSTLQ